MEEDKIKITINVAQRPIEMTINKEWESYYKEAEEIINKGFLDFARRWKYSDNQDILSRMLIDFVLKWKENEERLDEFDEELIPKMQNLKTLADEIDLSE
jgi:hypothetical protein